MNLQVEIKSEKYEIEIKREGKKVFARVGEREYELEVSQPESNIYLFKDGGEVHQVFVSPRKNSAEPFSIKIGNYDFDVNVFDPRKLRGSGSSDANADGIAEIKTAMPGKLVRILTREGAEISAGEGVLVVEAMKMQNEMKSPKDGIVKEIRFAEGATVNAGDILAIIE